MVNLFHVSIHSFEIGERIEPRRNSKAYFSTSKYQAAFWLCALSESRAINDIKHAYMVSIPEDIEVEDCPGHYAFERPGQMVLAKNINLKKHAEDCDGEVVIHNHQFSVVEKVNIEQEMEEYAKYSKAPCMWS